MWRVIFYFVIIAVIAAGFVWFADRPGEITVSWLDYEIETSLAIALGFVCLLSILVWSFWAVIIRVLATPGALSGFFRIRRQKQGFEALSKGMLAVGAGDAALAQKHANQASRWLSGEPLTLMLKAQTAQLNGKEELAGHLFKSMLQVSETELLGLQGLFIQAKRRGDSEAAIGFAAHAFERNPGIGWAARAVLTLQSAKGDWQAAEHILERCRGSKLIDRKEANRKQAVILSARAIELEENDDEAALQFALKAHKLASDLIPASIIAGRILSAKGNSAQAARIVAKTWRLSPHPDLAEIYGAAKSGEGPTERLKRIRTLVKKPQGDIEGVMALAKAAIEAKKWSAARTALTPLLQKKLNTRVCILMAEIEQGEFGDKGKTREWLARAVHAPKGRVWTADGFISEIWLPVSPVTGELDKFEWQEPMGANSLEFKNGSTPMLEPNGDMATPPEEAQETPVETDKIEENIQTIDAKNSSKTPVKKMQAKKKQAKPSQKEDSEEFIAPPVPDDPGLDDSKPSPKGWFRSFRR